MNSRRSLYLNVLLLSAVVLCFEIISTRISSMIFVTDYAFIIVSLAILGLGSGSIYSYYNIKVSVTAGRVKIISRTVTLVGDHAEYAGYAKIYRQRSVRYFPVPGRQAVFL
ncbi:MAG TPA: hypothetical protein VK470_00795 [Bacteroidota bacterium]|nr:hypothetical protein [Bacteroidota bacterium]